MIMALAHPVNEAARKKAADDVESARVLADEILKVARAGAAGMGEKAKSMEAGAVLAARNLAEREDAATVRERELSGREHAVTDAEALWRRRMADLSAKESELAAKTRKVLDVMAG